MDHIVYLQLHQCLPLPRYLYFVTKILVENRDFFITPLPFLTGVPL